MSSTPTGGNGKSSKNVSKATRPDDGEARPDVSSRKTSKSPQESETKVDKVVEERSDESGSEDSGDAPDEPPVPPRKVTSHSKESKTNKKRDDEEDEPEDSGDESQEQSKGNSRSKPSTKPTPSSNDKSWRQHACRATPTVSRAKLARHGHGSAHAVLAAQSKLWGSGGHGRTNIKYWFMDGDERQHNKVKSTIRIWQQYAFVTFIQAESIEDSHIRISFDTEDGSWSYIGKDALNHPGEATMNLAWVITSEGKPSSEEKGSILHEFGHALGMMHEHQSPARADLFLDEEATMEFYGTHQGWTRDMVQEQILDVYNKEGISSYSEFDKDSIMQYPVPKQLTRSGKDIPYNSDLSKTDKYWIFLAYPFTDSEQLSDAKLTLEDAFNALSISIDLQHSIQKYIEKGDLTNARLSFLGQDLSGHQREAVHHAITMPRSRPNPQHAFVDALSALMKFMPPSTKESTDRAEDAISPKIFEDPLRGPVVAELLSDAVIALHTRSKIPASKAAGFRDIFSDPFARDVLGQLLHSAVEFLKPSQEADKVAHALGPNNHAGAAHGFLTDMLKKGVVDVLKHPVFGLVANTLLDRAKQAVKDHVTKVEQHPEHAIMRPGVEHGFWGVVSGVASTVAIPLAKFAFSALF